MARFRYKAKAGAAQMLEGTIEAGSLREAIERLSMQGKIPLEIVADEQSAAGVARKTDGAPQAMTAFLMGRKTSFKAVCDLTRRLFDLIDAGVPIMPSLAILGRGLPNESLRKVMVRLTGNVQSGESLSTAMARYPEVFPLFYVHMVRAGESSGDLPGAIGRLADLLERDLKLRGKVAASLAYPGLVLGVGLLTFFVLLTFVMPQLTVLFEDMDAALPVATQIVMALSDLLASFWWLVVLLAAGIFWFFYRMFHTPAGRRMIEGAILKVPLVNDFIRQTETARMARVLGVLLEGGVPITTAMETVSQLVPNTVIQQELVLVARDVKGGQSFTTALKNHASAWPESAFSMVEVGEENGKLEKALFKLAAVMERETEATAGLFVTFLGPVVLLIVVAIVGAMILAVLLPLFQMNMIVQ